MSRLFKFHSSPVIKPCLSFSYLVLVLHIQSLFFIARWFLFFISYCNSDSSSDLLDRFEGHNPDKMKRILDRLKTTTPLVKKTDFLLEGTTSCVYLMSSDPGRPSSLPILIARLDTGPKPTFPCSHSAASSYSKRASKGKELICREGRLAN